ncbi:MAG: flavocytochrome c [Eubacteriales bacterium]
MNVKDGVFIGKSKGYGGDIELKVHIKNNKIKDIDIIKHSETKVISDPAFQSILPNIIEQNTICIPNVNGCSITSMALKTAVGNALISAGEDTNNINTLILESQTLEKIGSTTKIELQNSYDVIVIGSGGAGLSAAISAKRKGKSVLLIEKMNTLGGNTLVSMGGVNIPGSDAQIATGVEDDVDTYLNDIVVGGDGESITEQATYLAYNALPTYKWLQDEIGVCFKEKALIHFGGHSVPRATVFEGKYAIELITKFKEKAQSIGVTIVNSVKAEELTRNDERITGIIAKVNDQNKNIIANHGVILATGGFSGNIEMRMRYDSNLDERYKTTNVGGVTGEGHVMAEKIGAKFVHMDYIQTFPISNPSTGELSHVGGSRFDGAILINREGKRFIEELERRDIVSEGILSQSGGTAFLLWSSEVEDINNNVSSNSSEIDRLKKDDFFATGNTISEVANYMQIDAKELEITITKYNEFVKHGQDKDFNRRGALLPIAKAPYYIQEVAPAVHHTMGGIVINDKSEVIDMNNNVIKGLYAAGEIVGGTHGTNRLGGNAITEILVFGKRAGENIISYTNY